jgi:ribosome-associated protein
MDDLQINRRLTIPGRDLDMEATTGSGPGGQRRNRVRTKVVLKLDLGACDSLGPHRLARLSDRLGHRLTAAGVLRVACGRHREQRKNLIEARERMAALLTAALQSQRARKPTKPTAGSRRARKEKKQQQSRRKQDRSWRWG